MTAWKRITIHRRWSLEVPDGPGHLGAWDVFDYWELPRMRSMERALSHGDLLVDVGAEHGWLSALIAREMVGPEHIALIEPSPYFWPNIRQTWERNELAAPRACFAGLVGERTDLNPPGLDFNPLTVSDDGGWPQCSIGEPSPAHPYRYLHEGGHVAATPSIRLDDWLAREELIPEALNVDVEGAELSVLRGAVETLRTYHPKVWISIHPDLMERDYRTKTDDLHRFMESLRYRGEHIATDHEQHWCFR